ncbi:ATP-binding protein [Allostreptomyces psammosilenae]|uniref:DNA-binding CsgD family transcriptional regulator n=1 Tax=Allostreptomyces psammosilenae TaxID=1892865 RepID=A0A852ZTJ8_9ACTN|nr:helix-turn-helix transcriptional regulator [Allostreptomyces psammosilenae]NYI05175.1 DNA-binding CsgD family transcriptional regulator [Allostreptomyces psammosilenae]
MLHGRDDELAAIDALLAGARAGRSAAVVIRGEAGIGKSVLLDHAAAAAGHDMRVLRATGIESESELPFAGLHLLLGRSVDRTDALPDRQARALRGALGLEEIPGGDRPLVGLAVLTLLAELADERPLLCVVDDAHWLDHASADALLFAARRLDAEGVVLLFAARDLHAPPFPAPGIAELRLAGLDETAATALLDEHAGDLPRHAREQILGEARGNPLALRELTAAQREGQIPAYAHRAAAQPNHTRLQQTFADRIGTLPEATQTLLLVAAAEVTCDLAVVLGAAGRLGASVEDLEPAERKELLHLTDGQLMFRHPLIRTAAYRGAPVARRIAAHRALAEALPCVGNIDRRAWHLAAATTEPDENVASLLERTAEHARARGGYAAVASACERAAQLSPDSRDRARRLALAARAAADAGWIERAAVLADQAAPHLTDPLARAELAQVRALAPYVRGLRKAAHATLLQGASAAADHLPGKAAFMLFDAMGVIWATGDLPATEETAARVTALELPAAPDVTPFVEAAGGMAAIARGEPATGVPALARLIEDPGGVLGRLRPMERACVLEWAVLTGDLDAAGELTRALERECRDQGAVGVLPEVLRDLARVELFRGRHYDARITATEALRVAEETGQIHFADDARGVLAHLAAAEGDEENTRALTAGVRAHRTEPGEEWTTSALALLDLGAGRYEEALRRREELGADAARHSIVVLYTLPDHVEAAARLGAPAHHALARFEEWARATGQPWAEAVTLRCRALLAPEDEAGPLYARAVALHEQAVVPHERGGRSFERARTELLYGEWLRRAGHRADARPPLRSALDVFERVCATPWADRARAELRATGEARPRRTEEADPFARLTPQELQVVRLAATGLTNRDIGAQLFLSPRTVGYHLYNAYPKLGVASRAELARLDLGGR